MDTIKRIDESELVYSKPTKCLHCRLVVEMFHGRDADPVKGAWQCPRCGHTYSFTHWKIKKETNPKKRKPENAVIKVENKNPDNLLRQAFERYKERTA